MGNAIGSDVTVDLRPGCTAQVVLPAPDLQATIDFFVGRLGFALERISPADDPRRAWVTGHGLRLRLQRDFEAPPARLVLELESESQAAGTLVAPGGTVVELVARFPNEQLGPPPSQIVPSPEDAAQAWVIGRAGMQYRDLLPGRLGGHCIVSNIRIPKGGPVPDLVHHHSIRFQVIFCVQGWVRLVYEGQGEPFVMAAGDCVVQPPGLRHQVLEASDGLEVIEVASPAEHDTLVDRELDLPGARTAGQELFGGQRFVLHRGELAHWAPWSSAGYEVLETGILEATAGAGGVQVLRPMVAEPEPLALAAQGGCLTVYVLSGSCRLEDRGGEAGQAQPDAARVAEPVIGPGQGLTLAGEAWAQLRPADQTARLLLVRVALV